MRGDRTTGAAADLFQWLQRNADFFRFQRGKAQRKRVVRIKGFFGRPSGHEDVKGCWDLLKDLNEHSVTSFFSRYPYVLVHHRVHARRACS